MALPEPLPQDAVCTSGQMAGSPGGRELLWVSQPENSGPDLVEHRLSGQLPEESARFHCLVIPFKPSQPSLLAVPLEIWDRLGRQPAFVSDLGIQAHLVSGAEGAGLGS